MINNLEKLKAGGVNYLASGTPGKIETDCGLFFSFKFVHVIKIKAPSRAQVSCILPERLGRSCNGNLLQLIKTNPGKC